MEFRTLVVTTAIILSTGTVSAFAEDSKYDVNKSNSTYTQNGNQQSASTIPDRAADVYKSAAAGAVGAAVGYAIGGPAGAAAGGAIANGGSTLLTGSDKDKK